MGLLGRSFGVLGGPWEVIGGPWEVVGELLGGLRGCSGCLLGSSEGLGGPYGAIGWLMKTLKKRLFLHCFQHLGVLGGLLRALFSVFFDFRSYLRPFFRFPIVFSVFPIVFTSVFRFPIVFSVFFGFLGRCFLHERIHGRDSAPRGSGLSATQRNPAQPSGNQPGLKKGQVKNLSKWLPMD